MSKYLKNVIITLAIAFGLSAVGGLALASASTLPPGGGSSATTPSSKTDACSGVGQLDPTQACGTSSQSTLNRIVADVVALLSWAAGVIAVVMIIVAGFLYITSGGDSNRMGQAKTALIYAIVGFLVTALAQFLAHFVLSTA